MHAPKHGHVTRMALRYFVLDVFSDQPYAGNPLAVVLDADALHTRQMQRIAREFNLSETVFVQAPTCEEALARARIFTPNKELPFAGHPTVGTACLLAELGLAPQGEDVSFVLDEAVGPVPVRVVRREGFPSFGQLSVAQLPVYGPDAPPVEVLAAMLGLKTQDILAEPAGPRSVSCGVPYLMVPLCSPEVLASVSFDLVLWREHLSKAWADHVLVYARGQEDDWRLRMFAPGSGVMEDPATGSAAVALAGALASENGERSGSWSWLMQQGLEMGRPSKLYAEADKRDNQVCAVRVGGHSVRVLEGKLLY